MGKCTPKEAAALGAVELLTSLGVEPGIVGIGTGSTVARFIEHARGLLRGRTVVASSMSSAMQLASSGVMPVEPSVVERVDVYIDGADEVDPAGRLIKGRGAALLGEKILAYSSRLNIIIVDESKIVRTLGERKPLPIEVVPTALASVLGALRSMGIEASPREGKGKDGPVVSDWGGVIVDLRTGPISDPEDLEARLLRVPGIVETGLFIGLTDYVVIGREGCEWRVVKHERTRGSWLA